MHHQRKNTIKVGLFFLFFLGCIGNDTFANMQYSDTREDCYLFTSIKQTNYDPLSKNLTTDPILQIFGKEKLKIALSNLHAQCCASQSIKQDNPSCLTTVNNWKNRNNFPESTNLIDHLIDVQIRSWKSDSNYKGLPLDPDFKKRRDELKKNILDPQGKLPYQLTENQTKNRSYLPEEILPVYNDQSEKTFLNAIEASPALKTASNWNLRSKYLNTCALANYLNLKLSANSNKTSITALANIQCQLLINNLISEEMRFLQQAIIYKSNKQTTNTLEDYAINYFKNRSSTLQSELTNFDLKLLSTIRQIPRLTPKCN